MLKAFDLLFALRFVSMVPGKLNNEHAIVLFCWSIKNSMDSQKILDGI